MILKNSFLLILYFVYFCGMKSILNTNFKNKTVLIRVDFNVPLSSDFKILDDSRIVASLPTIKKCLSDGAKVVLMSHLGRPSGVDHKFSLIHLVSFLSSSLKTKVVFSNNCVGGDNQGHINQLNYGEVLLLENLRFYSEEKEGNVNFAKQLSSLSDVYINDAFGTAHRKHSSTFVISDFFRNEKYFGLLFERELINLEKALNTPKQPCTAIIGGAKVSDKIDVVYSLLEKVDNLIIGGGMAYTFIKALGGNIGLSIVENDKISEAKKIIKRSDELNVNLLLPVDSVNANKFDNNASINCSEINKIPDNYMGLDIGEKTIELFSKKIIESKTIIWNGPVGVFEFESFKNGTEKIAHAICQATERGSFSLVGGGDSVSAIKNLKLSSKISYISTGGGSMLEYMKKGALPVIESIL